MVIYYFEIKQITNQQEAIKQNIQHKSQQK